MKKSLHFLLRTFTLLAFVVVCLWSLFLAFGYRFNLEHQNIEKTSIIDLTNEIGHVQVFLDSQLKAQALPVQLRDIVPGYHFLSVQKENFLLWSRGFHVQPDVVTKIDDILLFPADVDSNTHDVSTFLEDSTFIYDHHHLVIRRPHQTFLTIFTFQSNGTLKQQEIEFHRLDFKKINFLDDTHLMIIFDNDSLALFDVQTGIINVFVFPFNPDQCKADISGEVFYCMNQNSLYRFSFDQLKNIKTGKNLAQYLFLENIEQFDFSSTHIYFLRQGVLFKVRKDAEQFIVISGTSMRLTNFSLLQHQDEFMILRFGDKRGLYIFDHVQNKVAILTPLLRGDVVSNQNKQILYSTLEGYLFYYDPLTHKRKLISQFHNDGKVIDWFGNQGHFVFEQEGEYYLSDFFFSNVYSFKLKGKITNIFVRSKNIFYLTDHVLKRVSL